MTLNNLRAYASFAYTGGGFVMRRISGLLHFALIIPFACASGGAALAQPQASIEWEVANRFRLFAEQKDFERHVAASRTNDGKIRSTLEIERAFAEATDGRGWARLLGRLCYDSFKGSIEYTCKRDGVEENYLNPKKLRVVLRARLPSSFGSANCIWTLGTGAPLQKSCDLAVDDQRVDTGKPTIVRLVARNGAGETVTADATIEAKDILIVGLGDSIASGEGNPSRPISMSDQGFCYRRIGFGNERFFLPGRAGVSLDVTCDSGGSPNDLDEIRKIEADWLFNPCHRSLYGYQARTALQLAVQTEHVSVTFLPLGCSGATIEEGMLDSQEARERPRKGGKQAPKIVEGQISQLEGYFGAKNNKPPFRKADLILLTIGANDIGFSGLVANVIVRGKGERGLLSAFDLLATPDDAREDLKAPLRANFRLLRTQLARFVAPSLERVVFTTYGNPVKQASDATCPSGRRGFDAHPAFAVDGDILKATSTFVENEFILTLKKYVTCESGGGCANTAKDKMSYVTAHRAAFETHGICVTAESDPEFDRRCFHDGDSFNGLQNGATQPMVCAKVPSEFHGYASRARWIRTVNDSYFNAMTYPSLGPFATPRDVHDAVWGLGSVVYGGAVHPTAEGHAAMADAALAEARRVLGIAPPSEGAPAM